MNDTTRPAPPENADEADASLLRAVFEALPYGTLIADSEGVCLDANPAACALLGRERGDVVGRRLEALGELEEAGRSLEWALASGEAAELRVTRPEGEARSCVLAVRRDVVAGRHLVTLRDIEDRKRSDEQLRHALRMEAVGRLAGGIAHDFNNLLTVINGYTEFLLREAGEIDAVRRNAGEIRRAAERASSLTRQLLAFSRKQVLNPKVIDLNDVVADMTKMLERLIGEDVALRMSLGADLPPVKADPGQIEQVIANLAVNARDAMPQGGTLSVRTEAAELAEGRSEIMAGEHSHVAPGRYVTLVVGDTGHGMDRRTLERVFEPFYTTKEMGKGTGLGLSTVYGIVRQSGGTISVSSEIGRGTTFRIFLPAIVEERPEPDPEPAPPETVYGTETILLAEDEGGVRRMAREALAELGYTVLEARDGAEACRIAERYGGAIDLLVTDVVMPNMSGREVADRLTAQRPGLRVLYMSGYTEEAIVHHGILAGGTAFLEKPLSAGSLAAKVRQVLEAGA